MWTEEMWAASKRRGEYTLSNNPEYLDKNTPPLRKEGLESAAIANGFFGVMNNVVYYHYVDNDPTGTHVPYDPNSSAGTATDAGSLREDEDLVWSDEWNGMYRKRELRYLDDYYQRLQDEFVLDNVNREDYARRVAKASLEADNKYQKMRQGTGTLKEWQDAQNVFDMLSKSGSFAESQRKEVVNTSMNALSTIIMDVELNHHNEMPQVTFPEDDIDKILRDFGFTGEAIA